MSERLDGKEISSCPRSFYLRISLKQNVFLVKPNVVIEDDEKCTRQPIAQEDDHGNDTIFMIILFD